ncbi:MAG TPA: hypothetical protein VN900_06050 [Stellaceae bacterium]|jgi:hypothetical protein|nr:hypothetical protein [Stellaceae bacterium]
MTSFTEERTRDTRLLLALMKRTQMIRQPPLEVGRVRSRRAESHTGNPPDIPGFQTR